MNSKRRLSLTSSAHKLKLDSVNKIIKSNKVTKQKNELINKHVSRIALAELIKNSPTPQRQCQPPDFRTFLSIKENVQVFKEFLQTQYCQENLEFYLRCENYRNLDPIGVSKELVKFYATQIFNDYLSENARQPINLNNACVQTIKDNLKDPRPDLFHDAQTEIFELMRADCYPRFCKTWELDRDLAQKILNQTLQSNQSVCTRSFRGNESTNTSYFLNASSTTSTSAVPFRQTSLRLSVDNKNLSNSSDSTSDCPPECPYFRVGRLPCQGHKRRSPRIEARERKSKLNTIISDHVDLRKIHRPVKVCGPENGLPKNLLASPPPPLPPKPDNVDLKHISNIKYRPYVGKVFNV